METKANHILIGVFMLMLVGALFGFVIWLSRLESGTFKEYDIYFEDSVAGLDVGGLVRFNGVPVGQVTKIALVPNDPSKVRTRIKVSGDAPVLQSTTATLEAQGLTGIAFVQLNGSMVGSPPLEKEGPDGAPIIPSRPSPLSTLFTSAPQLLQSATVAVNRIGQVLNDQNRAAIADTLANVATVTGGVAKRTPEIERSLVELEKTIKQVHTASASLAALADNTNGLITSDGKVAIEQIRQLAQRSNRLVDQLNETVAENRPGLNQFTETTIPEMTRLMIDLRELAQTLNHVIARIDEGGAQTLISGGKVQEYAGDKK